jgi:hypothetical protein
MRRLGLFVLPLVTMLLLGCGLFARGEPFFAVIVRNDRPESVWIAYDVMSDESGFVPGHYQYRAPPRQTSLAFSQPGGAGATRIVTVYDAGCNEVLRLEPDVDTGGSRLIQLTVGATVEVLYDDDVPQYEELAQMPEEVRCSR